MATRRASRLTAENGRLCYACAGDGMKIIILLLRAGFNPTIGRSAASALIDGALRRETSNWNHSQMAMHSRPVHRPTRHALVRINQAGDYSCLQ